MATDADAEATVLSIDGIGAYDHVSKWKDLDGVQHDVHQHEGGEQGDPLMPLLFSLAIHNALLEVKAGMRPGELLSAFLDDVYLRCTFC